MSPGRLVIDKAAIVAVGILVVDQATKIASFGAVETGEQLSLLPGISISETRNEGIAFGMFSGRPWIVFGLMFTALAVLVWFYVRNRARPILWLATGMLLGGALGNAIDRLSLGYVRDFVDLPHWPSFNVADVAITMGVVMLVFAADSKPQGEDKRVEADDHAAN